MLKLQSISAVDLALPPCPALQSILPMAFCAGHPQLTRELCRSRTFRRSGVGMVVKHCSLISLAMCFLGAHLALAKRSDKPIKIEVQFLADSTIVRSSYGENEDVYLVKLTAERGGSEAVFARLIDRYPPSGVSIPSEVLASEQQTRFEVHRDRHCDIAYRDFVLRARPGDPLAILPERLGFKPELSPPISPTDVLPCYRVVRK